MTETAQRFHYQSFTDYVQSLRVSGAYKSSSSSSDSLLGTSILSSFHKTHTKQALIKWSDLDSTSQFTEFHSLVFPLSDSIDSLTDSFDTIISSLTMHLSSNDLVTADPFLGVLIALARDLPSSIALNFTTIQSSLLSPIAVTEGKCTLHPQRINSTFKTLSILFKVAGKELHPLLDQLFPSLVEFLGHHMDFVRNLFGQALAAFFRSQGECSFDILTGFFQYCSNLDTFSSNLIEGIGQFIFELISAVSTQFHTFSLDILRIVFIFAESIIDHGTVDTVTPLLMFIIDYYGIEHEFDQFLQFFKSVLSNFGCSKKIDTSVAVQCLTKIVSYITTSVENLQQLKFSEMLPDCLLTMVHIFNSFSFTIDLDFISCLFHSDSVLIQCLQIFIDNLNVFGSKSKQVLLKPLIVGAILKCNLNLDVFKLVLLIIASIAKDADFIYSLDLNFCEFLNAVVQESDLLSDSFTFDTYYVVSLVVLIALTLKLRVPLIEPLIIQFVSRILSDSGHPVELFKVSNLAARYIASFSPVVQLFFDSSEIPSTRLAFVSLIFNKFPTFPANVHFIETLSTLLSLTSNDLVDNTEVFTILTEKLSNCLFTRDLVLLQSTLSMFSSVPLPLFLYSDPEDICAELIGQETRVIINHLHDVLSSIFSLSQREIAANFDKIATHLSHDGLPAEIAPLLIPFTFSLLTCSFAPTWTSCRALLAPAFRMEKFYGEVLKYAKYFIDQDELVINDNQVTFMEDSFVSSRLESFLTTFFVPPTVSTFLSTCHSPPGVNDLKVEIFKLVEDVGPMIRGKLLQNVGLFKFLVDKFLSSFSEAEHSFSFQPRLLYWYLRCFSSIGGRSVKSLAIRSQSKNQANLDVIAKQKPSLSKTFQNQISVELLKVFDIILSFSDSAAQFLAFNCICCYSFSEERKAIFGLNTNFFRLISEISFRGELTNFNLAANSPIISDSIKPFVVPRLLSILIGKLQKNRHQSMIFEGINSGGQKIPPDRLRSTITSFLSQLTAEDLEPFFKQISFRFWKVGVFPINYDSFDFNTTSLKIFNEIHPSFALTSEAILSKYLNDFSILSLAILNATFLNTEGQFSAIYKSRQSLRSSSWIQADTTLSVFLQLYQKYLENESISSLDLNTLLSHWFSCFSAVSNHYIPDLPSLITDDVDPSLAPLLSSLPTGFISLIVTLSKDSLFGSKLLSYKSIIRFVLLLPRIGGTTMKLAKSSAPALQILNNLCKLRTDAAIEYLTEYSGEIVQSLVVLLFSSKCTRNRLTGKTFINNIKVLSEFMPYANQKDCDLILTSLIDVLFNCPTEYLASLLLGIVSDCFKKSVEIPEKFLYSLPKLFLFLTSQNSIRSLLSVYESFKIVNPLVEFDLLQNLNSFTDIGDKDVYLRTSTCQIVTRTICENTNITQLVNILPIFYTSVRTLAFVDDLPLRHASSAVLHEIISFVCDNASSDQFKYILNSVVIPQIRRYTISSHLASKSEFLTLFKFLIFSPAAPQSLSELSIFTSTEAESCPLLNLGHVQAHRRTRALKRIAKIIEESTVSQSTLNLVFVKLCLSLLAMCSRTTEAGVAEGISEVVKAVGSQLIWRNYYSLLLKLLRGISNPSKIFKLKLRDHETRMFEKYLILVIGALVQSWHFDIYSVETKLPPKAIVPDSESEEESDCSSSESESDSDDEEEIKRTKPKEKPRESLFSVTEGKIEILNNSIFTTLKSKVLPLILKLLRFKPKSKVTIQKKTSRRNRGVQRASLSIIFISLLKKLPEKVVLSQLPRLLHVLVDGLRDEEQTTRDTVRNALGDVIVELQGKYLDSFISTVKNGLPRGIDRHVAGYTCHYLLKRLNDSLTDKSWIHFGCDILLPDLLELIFEEVIGGVGEEKDVKKLADRCRETGAKLSQETARLLAQNINFSPNATLIVSALKAASLAITTLSDLSKIENLANSFVHGFLANPTADSADVLTFVYVLLHWTDFQTKSLHTVVKFDKLYGFKDGRSVITRSEQSNMSLDAPFSSSSVLQPTFASTFKIPPSVDFSFVKTTQDTDRSKSLLPLIGVSLLFSLMKKKEIPSEMIPQLTSLLPDLIDQLESPQSTNDITERILKILNIVLRRKDVPIESTVCSRISDSLFFFLKRGSSGGSFVYSLVTKCLQALLDRQTTRINKDEDVTVLLIFCRTKLFESDHCDTGLSIIKNLVRKGHNNPELIKIMEKFISKYILASSSDTTRKLSGEILASFLSSDAISRDPHCDRKLIGFLLGNLAYDLQPGREAVIETLNLFIESSTDEKLIAHYHSLFLSLLLQMSKEKETVLEQMLKAVALKLCSRLVNHSELFENCVSFVEQWLLTPNDAANALDYHTIGAQSLSILAQATENSSKWNQHYDKFSAIIFKLFKDAVGTGFSLWVTIRNYQDDLRKSSDVSKSIWKLILIRIMLTN
ncbi:hypothetical protein GEMRC1_007670 [Eukaryota sp. GEM-RC1]